MHLFNKGNKITTFSLTVMASTARTLKTWKAQPQHSRLNSSSIAPSGSIAQVNAISRTTKRRGISVASVRKVTQWTLRAAFIRTFLNVIWQTVVALTILCRCKEFGYKRSSEIFGCSAQVITNKRNEHSEKFGNIQIHIHFDPAKLD